MQLVKKEGIDRENFRELLLVSQTDS